MMNMRHFARLGAAAFAITSLGACAQNGLGSVLGSVLGGQQQGGNQVSGTVRGVDQRNSQIVLVQSNGQQVGISYDNQTKIVYNNQNYTVTSLENGDQVTARIQQTQNGSYYTDYVQVDQSVSSNNGGVYNGNGGVNASNGQVQSLQGTVRRVDVGNGWFEIQPSNSVVLTVTLPYNASRADVQRFQNLRQGDVVRFNGVYLNNSRVELRQFY